MIVTIHQPEHLPWLGYFHKMARADLHVFLDNVQYRKNYYQNRNQILTYQGPTWLTVPVKHRGHMSSTLREMEISGPPNWRKKYWRTLELAYKKHPYFHRYAPFFEELLATERTYLVDLNYAIIQYLAQELDVHPQFVKASDLGVAGSSSELLLEICVKLGATVYLSGPSGRDYLDLDLFRRHGIRVEFHQFTHPVYPQYGRTDFTPRLSVIDLLSNVGPEARDFVHGG